MGCRHGVIFGCRQGGNIWVWRWGNAGVWRWGLITDAVTSQRLALSSWEGEGIGGPSKKLKS